MSKFQVITLAIFILAIVAGVIAFATYKGSSSNNQIPAITVWGTFPATTFTQYVGNINNTLANGINVTYVEKSPDTFATDFVNALATGRGPDAILVSSDALLTEENKLVPVPYAALSERTFLDTYVQEANMYLTSTGALAIPFTIDPLVMYWNRDTFNTAGIANYPKYWDEFTDLNHKLTVKDQNGNVRKSAVAMGTLSNITNGRELLGSLIMQVGNPITVQNADGSVSSAFSASTADEPATALTFFSQFTNPASDNYSWNRALNNDKVTFLSGDLATYFGFASEISDLRAKNPNLNFDVAPLPQVRQSQNGKIASYGRMYGFSIVAASPRQNAAYQTISILTSPQYLKSLGQTMYLPTVLNSLDQSSTDPYIDNFNKAALISRSWLDGDIGRSRQIMSDMVDSVVSGQKTALQAVEDAGNAYNVSLKQAVQ